MAWTGKLHSTRTVMAGLVPAITSLARLEKQDVDARHKARA